MVSIEVAEGDQYIPLFEVSIYRMLVFVSDIKIRLSLLFLEAVRASVPVLWGSNG
jgi:hypothetical protein